MSESPLLQVCPNDHPPFLDICSVYRAAADSLGRELITVFFSAANAAPMPGAVYLDLPALGRTRTVAAALDARLPRILGSTPPAAALAICHRYRAYRAVRASRLTRGPRVVIAHEFGFFDRWRRRADRKLFAGGIRFAGVSAPVVQELARTVEDPLLMPNGIDLGRAAAQRVVRPEALQALKLDDAHFNVGVVGRLHPKKQPQLALAGFAALAARVPDAHLVFIGDGELDGSLRDAARGLPVSFAGFVPGAARYFAALDALLIPSGEREAFNMVAVEAMAARVPVIAGPTPGPRFVLGDAGYYFDAFTADALAAAVSTVVQDRREHAERLDLRVQQGIERVEKEFSVAAVARRIQSLL